MKVLYYCPEYYCNYGARTHARGFFHALEKLPSVSSCYLYPKNSEFNEETAKDNKKLSRSKLSFLPPTLRMLVRYFRPKPAFVKKLSDAIELHGCDVLVIRTNMSPPDYRRIKQACPRTLICLEINGAGFDESGYYLPFKSFFQKWEVAKYNYADAISVVSTDIKSYLVEHGTPADKILVNQNGVSIDTTFSVSAKSEQLRQQLDLPAGAFVLGYIGGMEYFRKLPKMLELVAELRRQGNLDIYLVLVGDGADMPTVKSTIEEQSKLLGEAVKCVGWQDHAEVPKFLSVFDLAIFPFTNDYCSPLKLFEYLGAGLPTIGPDTPAVKEVFKDGVHLKLVKQDGSDFISTVLALKNNPQLRAKLAQTGQKLVLEEYTWEKNAQRVVDHVQQMRELSATEIEARTGSSQ